MFSFLEPYGPWIMALSMGCVVVARRSIRKWHIVALLAATALAVAVFFVAATAVVAFGYTPRSTGLAQLMFVGSSAVAVACGPSVGVWAILRWLGLARAE